MEVLLSGNAREGKEGHMENETNERQAEEQRKAVITVTEGESIDVTIEFFPDAITENPTPSAHLAMIGFQAIARAVGGVSNSNKEGE